MNHIKKQIYYVLFLTMVIFVASTCYANAADAEYAIIKIRTAPTAKDWGNNVEIYFEDKAGHRIEGKGEMPLERHPIEVTTSEKSGNVLYLDQAIWYGNNEFWCVGWNGHITCGRITRDGR